VPFDPPIDIEFLTAESLPYHPNGLSFLAEINNGEHVAQTYYSVGGGFIEQENLTNRKKFAKGTSFSHQYCQRPVALVHENGNVGK